MLWAGLALRTQGCRHNSSLHLLHQTSIWTMRSQIRSQHFLFLFFFFSSFVAPSDINLDNEITNQVTTLLFFFSFLLL